MKANQNNTRPANSNQSSTNANLNSQSAASSSGSNTNMGSTSGKGGLNGITGKLQNLGSSSLQRVNSLSTTQKIIGGSLLALGAGWMAMGKTNQSKLKDQVSRLGKKNLANNGQSNRKGQASQS